jgi:CHASE3 domain sensor protein
MRIPIFWRLLLSYSAILLLSVGLSTYSIIQLGGLGAAARAALETGTRRIATIEILTDAFLSEVRYAGRFVITHAQELHDQYRQFNGDFNHSMRNLQALSASAEIHSRLSRIADLHHRYNDLFSREVSYIQSAQPYGESRYQQEKEKVLESALRELGLLNSYSHKNLQTKLEEMERAAVNGRTLAIATTLILVGLGFVLCYKISKNITGPLAELQRNTANDSAPRVHSPPEYYRIPEIQELAETLRAAQDRVRAAHESNAAFVHRISAELATPLVSLKNRLNYLNTTLEKTTTAEQRTNIVVLADETERLLQACARLHAPALPVMTTSALQTGFQAPGAVAAKAALTQQAVALLKRVLTKSLLVQTNRHGEVKSHEDSPT